MLFGRLSVPIVKTFNRILMPRFERSLASRSLHKHVALLSQWYMEPSVKLLVLRNITPCTQFSNCANSRSQEGSYTTLRQERRGYAVKSSGSSRTRIIIDPMARYGGLDPTTPQLGFENVKELEDADDQVKKIFSLEFADDTAIQEYRKTKLVQAVQKDPTDMSLPVRIAILTIHIRAAAKQLALSKKDLRAKQILFGLIGRRRRFLKHLRKTDYERFERLLVELGITYTLPPPPQAVRFHTRRFLEKLTVRKKAKEQRDKALGEYLEEQREKHMKEIADLKKELGIDLTEDMKSVEKTEGKD